MDLGDAHLAGIAAGLGTSVCWVLTSLFFSAAGRRIGPTLVNSLRLVLAVVLLGGTFALTSGRLIPEASAEQWLWFALSGIIGLALGDQALFTAFVDIGPRLALLVMTTAPIAAAVLGWAVLGETLSLAASAGIAVTVAGVAWVIVERRHTAADDRPHPHRRRGLVLAGVGALCQAIGLLFSKLSMGYGDADAVRVDPLAATYGRMLFGLLGVLPILVIHRASLARDAKGRPGSRTPRRTARVGRPSTGLALMACGAVVGPYLGVWLSLVTADLVPLGIAQTLCSLAPVMILPIAVFTERGAVTSRAVVGAVIAVGGVALLAVATA